MGDNGGFDFGIGEETEGFGNVFEFGGLAVIG
jgi:hypothetical protein